MARTDSITRGVNGYSVCAWNQVLPRRTPWAWRVTDAQQKEVAIGESETAARAWHAALALVASGGSDAPRSEVDAGKLVSCWPLSTNRSAGWTIYSAALPIWMWNPTRSSGTSLFGSMC